MYEKTYVFPALKINHFLEVKCVLLRELLLAILAALYFKVEKIILQLFSVVFETELHFPQQTYFFLE